MKKLGPALRYVIRGLKCDAAGCDYRDDSVVSADYPQWLDAPCPKCGAPLLTRADYEACLRLEAVTAMINAAFGPVEQTETPAAAIRVEMRGDGSISLVSKVED